MRDYCLPHSHKTKLVGRDLNFMIVDDENNHLLHYSESQLNNVETSSMGSSWTPQEIYTKDPSQGFVAMVISIYRGGKITTNSNLFQISLRSGTPASLSFCLQRQVFEKEHYVQQKCS